MNLEDYQNSWNKKPVLRAIYSDLYQKIENVALAGDTLEIGGGIGNFKIGSSRIIRSDIQHSEGLDVVADAQTLPFDNEVFSNIVLFDVLHHLQCPLLFFAEAQRVLKPGGRVIMVEPGITPVSKLLYKMGHEEPVEMEWDMNEPCKVDADKDPYDSNQAIPTILFKRDSQLFLAAVKGFKINSSDWLSLFAYPLSGGFKSWSLLPYKWVHTILKIEERILPFLGSLMAFRLMVVLEKDG
ncbi:MAG TPA: class I SAM-dependent methyltransferase [Piscirickettsiaceae bacterium]|nr:class I SAM-dependent methyltransferase [Piscirickettsiaceae bacterium]